MKHFVLGVIALCFAASHAAAQQGADVIVRHVSIVDVEHGRLIGDQAVVTRGDRIVAVGRDGEVAKAWQAKTTIQAGGKFLIPGLWDMHMHFGGGPDLIAENQALLPLYIANGITTVREASGDLPDDVLAWRGQIARGTLQGPTLLSSGPKIEGLKPIWKGTLEVGSESDADKAIAHLQQVGVDFVKITDSTLKPELFLYSVSRAKSVGLKTSGHIPMSLTVKQAMDAGISSIEHLDYVYRAGSKAEETVVADLAAGRIDRAEAARRLDAGFDRETAMAVYRDMARRGVFVTPTLHGSRILAYLDRDKHTDDANLAYVGPKLRDTYQWRIGRIAGEAPSAAAFRHAHFERMATIIPMLQEAGVTIMAGTDAGFLNSFNYPGFSLHDELELYVKLGLTPQQALVSATRAGPAWFGKLDRYGSVETGKAADLLLLDANPLADIAATRAIRTVVLRGSVYDRSTLDGLLSDARAKVAKWNAETAR